MTEDITERLLSACNGWPSTTISWPHRLLHEAREEIEKLRGEIATDTVTIKRSELEKAVYLLNKAHDVSIVVSDKYYDNRLIIIEDSQREALKIIETALGEKK